MRSVFVGDPRKLEEGTAGRDMWKMTAKTDCVTVLFIYEYRKCLGCVCYVSNITTNREYLRVTIYA